MMRKIIKIRENVAEDLLSDLLSESFTPVPEQVNIIKDYLDKHFRKTQGLDDDGSGTTFVKTVTRIENGQPLEVMQISGTDGNMTPNNKLILHLDDKFNGMIKDDKDRRKFIALVVHDWYNNDIKPGGVLSVNIG